MLLSTISTALLLASSIQAASIAKIPFKAIRSLKSSNTQRDSDYNNFVYLIRHGEKPADGSDGLTAQGEERAQCLVNVFAANTTYDIGYIMAETPKSSGARDRPYLTVLPLATSLGLTVDISCDRDDPDCVADAVAAFAATSTQSILICWEHAELTDIVESLGVDSDDAPVYPDDSYNLIWTLQDETILSDDGNEDCPGLDD